MTQSDEGDRQPSVPDVALIVGGGPGISSSCARLFAQNGMRVAIAARDPDKPVLQSLEKTHSVRRYACDASEPAVRRIANDDKNWRFFLYAVRSVTLRFELWK